MMEPVEEHIRQRNPQGISQYSSNDTEVDQTYNSKKSEGTHSYRNHLLTAVSIPLLILLVFGGRLSVLIVCFGGLSCYIFDLLGAAEITFLIIAVTIMGMLGSLIYAAKVFLSEYVLNFSLVIVMGLVLFQLITIMSSFFENALTEMAVIFEVLDPTLFATLPVISASLISWFLCVEVPALDLESCFAIIYFIYVATLLGPRYRSKQTHKRSAISNVQLTLTSESTLVLPLYIMKVVWLMPVLMCPAMHIALHHNVLSTTKTRVLGVLTGFVFPAVLMTFCARRHIGYWPAAERDGTRSFLDRLQAVLVLVLLVCWQDHPMLDELKSFSGLEEPYPSYLIGGAAFLLFLGYGVLRFASSYRAAAEEIDLISASSSSASRARSGEYLSLLESVVSVCIGLSTALLSVLVSIPNKVLPVSMFGAMAAAEFYHRPSWAATNRGLLLVIAAISLAIVAAAFTHSTVFHLLFGFSWHVDLTMQEFCSRFALLLACAVIVPGILVPSWFATNIGGAGGSGGDGGLLSALPGTSSVGDSAQNTAKNIARHVFLFSMVVLTYVFACGELMMREQDWSSLEVAVETIYPTYYLLGSAAVVMLTTAGLYSASIIGPASLWVLAVIQACKLLHLVGLPSKACFSVGALMLTYTLPFVRHISEYFEKSGADGDSFDGLNSSNNSSTTLHRVEVVFYAVSAIIATYWARSHIAYTVLSAVLGTADPSDLQLNTACVGLLSFYLSCLLLVFYRDAKVLRSVLLGVVVLCVLVATEGLGKLTFAVSPSSSFYLSVSLHPDLAVNGHTGLFMVLSGALTLMAFVGLIPLQNMAICLVYTLVFSFISAKAMMGWAFPLSLGDVALTHDVVAFPFVYIFASKFVNTFVALRHSDASSLVDIVFGVACVMPFFAVIYAWLFGLLALTISGVVWATMVSTALLAVSVRSRDFFSDVRLLNKNKNAKGGKASAAQTATYICAVNSVLLIFWTALSTYLDVRLDRDLLVPVSTLLVLTTKHGTLLPDTHPIAIVAALCTVWWVLSAGHCMFVKGFSERGSESFESGGDFVFQQHSIFGLDHDISVWTSGFSAWMHAIHASLLLLPLPGIAMSFLRRKGDSEEVLLMLAILSAIATVGGPVGSIRYLGLLGAVYAGWRCYDIGQMRIISDRLI